MQVFEILTGWPPAEWDTNPDYIKFRNFVRTVKVTNNCAERGVKLTTDYSKQVPHQGQPGMEQDLSGGGGREEGQARRQEGHSQHMIYFIISYDNITNDLHDLIKGFSLGILSSYYIITKG